MRYVLSESRLLELAYRGIGRLAPDVNRVALVAHEGSKNASQQSVPEAARQHPPLLPTPSSPRRRWASWNWSTSW